MDDKALAGCHILVIEDDFYQAEDACDYLTAAGAVIVSRSGTIPDLDALLACKAVHIALLDINLGQASSFDLARALGARDIPFVFLTGYDPEILPVDLAEAALITKPADASAVVRALCRQLDAKGFSAGATQS